jgi:hypothetical protein
MSDERLQFDDISRTEWRISDAFGDLVEREDMTIP